MRCHHWIALASWLACAACGSGKGMEDEGEDCQSEDFGTVMIELQRSAAEASDPFVGTASIIASLDYEDCLSGFYTEDHPEYQQDGVEGAAIFGAWADGCLCDMDNYDEAIPACTVQSMSQNINTQGTTAAPQSSSS